MTTSTTGNTTVYPRSVDHIGISVDDIEQAVEFYSTVLGFTLVASPGKIENDDSYVGRYAAEFYPDFESFTIAHMSAGNGFGVALFEWADSERSEEFEYWRNGFFHLAVIDPNIERFVDRIIEAGGTQRSAIWNLYEDQHYRGCYCEDPFGNVIEVVTHPHEMTHSNQEP